MSVIIRLQNLPLSANAANIRTFFQGLKIPDGGVNIVGGEDGDAFIAFATDDDARKAMLLNNQPINGVQVRLLLSSKQEMQSIITEAQSKVLKRSNMSMSSNTSILQTQIEKRSYTLYNPQSKCSNESYDSNNTHKMRIIDYSPSTNSNSVNESYDNKPLLLDEPPRPSEFSYRSSKVTQPINHAIINNIDKPSYHYDYNYGNTYENYSHQQYDNNESNYDYYYNKHDDHFHGNDLTGRFDEVYDNCDDYYENNEYFDHMEHSNMRKSLLPTPPLNSQKHNKYIGRPLNRYHDYSERPPWLEESIVICQSNMVRVSLPFSLVSEQIVLEIFKNISISSKRGIRIEIDTEKRQTGYIYILFSNGIESMKAMKLNGKSVRGTNVIIESITDVDINKVCDMPDMCATQLEIPFNQRSPYFRDLCIEIINVSIEVNEKDVKDFLNVSMDNKRINFIEHEEHTCCLINAVDERMMLKILSFNGAIFRFNSIKVVSISKWQLKAYLNTGKRDTKRENNTLNPLVAARKYLAESGKNILSCAKFENLKSGTTISDLSQLFPATIIPRNNITVHQNEAVVDFISSATCQKIISDLKSRSNIDFIVTAITNSEYQSLKTKYLNGAGSNGRVSVTTSVNNLPSNTSKPTINQERTRVKIKNLPTTAGNLQIKELCHDFEYQPVSIQICFANGRNIGEAILTFMNAMEAIAFKDEFHGKVFLQKELEVLLSDRI